MKLDKEPGNEVAAGCMLGVVAIVFGTLSRGYALSVLWDWFARPLFTLPHLTWSQAYGLVIVCSAFRGGASDEKKSDRTMLEIGARTLGWAVFYPLGLLGIGWVVKGFL